MQLYPALDLRGGRLARAASEQDPVAVLRAWGRAGATWVHVVDLDRAAGTGANGEVVTRVLAARGGVHVQLGGGLTNDAVTRALSAGVSRVIVGSAGVSTLPDLVRRHGAARLGFALDLRDGSAWTPDGARVGDPASLFAHAVAAGIRTVVVRDLTRDGTLTGSALDGLEPYRVDGVDLVLAGGTASLDDLAAARDAGLAGAIVGRALLEGRFTLAEALACCG